MLARTEEFTISPIRLPNQHQIQGEDIRKVATARGYTHIHIDDDNTFSGMDPHGCVVERQYVFMRKVLR